MQDVGVSDAWVPLSHGNWGHLNRQKFTDRYNLFVNTKENPITSNTIKK